MTKNAAALPRRHFLRAAALAAAAAPLAGRRVFAAGSDTLRVGLVGCGERGLAAAANCVQSSPGVELVALGDLFKDRVDAGFAALKKDLPQATANLKPEACFAGFDACRQVLAADVGLVLLATPPHFRPAHLQAAVEAGRNVFMEKPVAVDPAGVRSVLASVEKAKQKGLAVVAGTQRRHQAHYLDLMQRLHDGAIGEIVAGQCYWNMGAAGPVPRREPGWSDMEYQCRQWFFFCWLSGDHIVEQHVHNLDVMNWALGSHPLGCTAMGGREVRKGPEYGNIFDHFAVEYEYPNGVRVSSMCRQIPGCNDTVCERLVGTKGRTYTDGGYGTIYGANEYRTAESPDPYVQEHADLIRSIRAGQPLNEGREAAESTLTAILGRMSAYTGRTLKWNWVLNASKLDLTPKAYAMGPLPVDPPPVPGKTALV